MCFFISPTVRKPKGTTRETQIKTNLWGIKKKKPNPHTKNRRDQRRRARLRREQTQTLSIAFIRLPSAQQLAAFNAALKDRRFGKEL